MTRLMLLSALLLAPANAFAQGPSMQFATYTTRQEPRPTQQQGLIEQYDRTASAMLGAALVGLVSTAPGAVIGSAFCDRRQGDGFQCLGAVVGGMILGWSAGVALGAHAGNRSRGHLGKDLLASFGTLLGASLLVSTLNENDGESAIWVMIPVVQIAATVSTEIRTGRGR